MTKRRNYQIVASFIERHKTHVLVIGFFFVVTCLLTWPFIIHPTTTQIGAKYGDIVGSTNKFEILKNERANPFYATRLETVAIPDGIRSNVGVDRVSFFSTVFLWGFTELLNATFAHNLYVFFGYFLTAIILYLFMARTTKSTRLAVVAGLVYITFPLYISLARAAPVYMWAWLYILPIWSFVELTKKYSNKQLLLTCLSMIPGIFWTPYVTLHTILIVVCCVAVLAGVMYRKTNYLLLRPLLTIGLFLALVLISYYVIGRTGGSASIPNRSLNDAYEQSLHPLMLVYPTARTVITAPLYEQYLLPFRPRGVDTNLYIGITVIIFACIGAYATIKSRLPKDMRQVGVFAIAISVTLFAFSLAPTIHIFGIALPTPNYLVVHLVPALRAGQRLVVPLMLGLSILAIFGIYYLSKRLRLIRPALVLCAAVSLILVEYSTAIDEMTVPVHTSPAVSKLSKMQKGIVAEYMNDSLIGYPGQLARKNYAIHRFPTVNSCSLDIYTEPGQWPAIEAIDRLPLNEQIKALQTLQVRYLITDKTNQRVNTHLDTINFPVIAEDSTFRIYSLR